VSSRRCQTSKDSLRFDFDVSMMTAWIGGRWRVRIRCGLCLSGLLSCWHRSMRLLSRSSGSTSRASICARRRMIERMGMLSDLDPLR
jgi:hypothetical protein